MKRGNSPRYPDKSRKVFSQFSQLKRMSAEVFHGTTILSVRRGNRVALGGDGQVTLGNIVVKATARKVRRDRRAHV